jgi:hypothetical protein
MAGRADRLPGGRPPPRIVGEVSDLPQCRYRDRHDRRPPDSDDTPDNHFRDQGVAQRDRPAVEGAGHRSRADMCFQLVETRPRRATAESALSDG